MRALCVGRHPYIAEHLGRFFARFGLQTSWTVGVEDAVRAAWRHRPQLVICDYEVLATYSLEPWEHDTILSRTPVMGVSLTRRPEEVNPLDVNGIGGFIYLPHLTEERARHLFSGVRPPTPYSPVQSVGGSRLALVTYQSGD